MPDRAEDYMFTSKADWHVNPGLIHEWFTAIAFVVHRVLSK